jgi:hypothetical protein
MVDAAKAEVLDVPARVPVEALPVIDLLIPLVRATMMDMRLCEGRRGGGDNKNGDGAQCFNSGHRFSPH